MHAEGGADPIDHYLAHELPGAQVVHVDAVVGVEVELVGRVTGPSLHELDQRRGGKHAPRSAALTEHQLCDGVAERPAERRARTRLTGQDVADVARLVADTLGEV